jgi:histidinol-phosphate aminotransferase
MTPTTVHGGPDALGVPVHDFSTNSNACGPCPHALAVVQSADATRYPDPNYTALRERLAERHGVATWRVVVAASASEFIYRITNWVAQQQRFGQVAVPVHSYGDYAAAAQSHGLGVVPLPNPAAMPGPATLHLPGGIKLLWCCDPSSPLGQGDTVLCTSVAALRPATVVVLDRVYAPLRLSGTRTLTAALAARVWQLHSPNKALGLTGIRAAYAIAPEGSAPVVAALQACTASWPVGAHGVAMLQAWCDAASTDWLGESLQTLCGWKARQMTLCESLGWLCQPSDANFFCASPINADNPAELAGLPQRLAALRSRGIKLRDATSFGLPGLVRLGVLPPTAQDALVQAWRGMSA